MGQQLISDFVFDAQIPGAFGIFDEDHGVAHQVFEFSLGVFQVVLDGGAHGRMIENDRDVPDGGVFEDRMAERQEKGDDPRYGENPGDCGFQGFGRVPAGVVGYDLDDERGGH